MEMASRGFVYYIFTLLMPNTSTRLILKKPKTDSSIRKVWLPKTLAYILREWKAAQDELRDFFGDEYQDFNLVVSLPNGRSCEDRIILKEFSKLREEAGLPRSSGRTEEAGTGAHRPCRSGGAASEVAGAGKRPGRTDCAAGTTAGSSEKAGSSN